MKSLKDIISVSSSGYIMGVPNLSIVVILLGVQPGPFVGSVRLPPVLEDAKVL